MSVMIVTSTFLSLTSLNPATGKRQTKNQSKHKNMEDERQDPFISQSPQVIPSLWRTFSSSFRSPKMITTSVRTASRQICMVVFVASKLITPSFRS
ncbi:hypothetical protein EDB82DRAFT_217113 [Fusarium venenatum]|uniref:uncharacterized protein n=1 Tax=Fusarium venenatum TaxID=56646 RepID=UPI001DDAA287|nr:hypothetical protein EDB82DRAFT_217113 [Fusarium venenatum]